MILVIGFLFVLSLQMYGQKNANVSTVYVLFMTHLDVGFTDLSSVVTKRYVEDFIPNAIKVADELRADHSGDRYVWTTGSWLIWKYLHSATPDQVQKLEKAIRRGDISWVATPYTMETETMNKEVFETLLNLSKRLDCMYGKHTTVAKMTDAPGHTRSIITPLSDAGVQFLHIGVNPASAVPDVPKFCRWRDTNGKEIILTYQGDYGSEDLLPDGKSVMSIQFTGDNHGPHTYQQVKKIYADLRKKYPHAKIVATTFEDIAQLLVSIKRVLPVVTSEIGDTWIYGYGSSPIRMAKFRKLSALYSQWVREGKIDEKSDTALQFIAELGLIAEHTQGMDVKTHLANWDKYDVDAFQKAKNTAPFQKVEASWRELDDYLESAISYLPASLQKEAEAAFQQIDNVKCQKISAKGGQEHGTVWEKPLIGSLAITGLTYQTCSQKDYDHFFDRYLRARYDWALCDFGKPGLDRSHACSAMIPAQVVRSKEYQEKNGTRWITDIAFPKTDSVDARTYPKRMQTDVFLSQDGRHATVSVTIQQKPAVRLPEAYWLSFQAKDILSVMAQKMGEEVDVSDVVMRGNRQMHGIDRYVDIKTASGTYRIYSDEAFLVSIGKARGLSYSTAFPHVEDGISFNLSNNLWGTNFSMWNEGSLTYHFYIEKR